MKSSLFFCAAFSLVPLLLVACNGGGSGTGTTSPHDNLGGNSGTREDRGRFFSGEDQDDLFEDDDLEEYGSSAQMSSQDDFGMSPLSRGNGVLRDSRDGKSYKTVRIGTQTWMAENLNYKTENSYCYDDDPANCNTYGRIYTWPAAVGMSEEKCGYGHVCGLVGTVRGVCPLGWHVPSKEDWETLIAFVGGKSVMGMKLKSSSGWKKGNGTDDFGFSALPGGYRDRDDDTHRDGVDTERKYGGMGSVANFWSSTEDSPRGETGGSAYSMNLIDDDENPDAGFYAQYKNHDICYVRCIKD